MNWEARALSPSDEHRVVHSGILKVRFFDVLALWVKVAFVRVLLWRVSYDLEQLRVALPV
jgi:hypothetical protein